MKKILLILTLIIGIQKGFCAGGTIVTYTIDPEKNAYLHNNKGIECASEKDYYCAIEEFKIAISLNPKKQSTAVYFNNLGKTYMTIGYPNLALDCFENALKQYNLNFEYYKNLADCYDKLGMTKQKLKEYGQNAEKNPLNKIMVALLKEKTGDSRRAIIILDNFIHSEKDLLITPAIKNHINSLLSEMNEQ